MSDFTHLNKDGNVRMVDITRKIPSLRIASAKAKIIMNSKTIEKISDGSSPKGDVFSSAKIAGIQAAKKTSEIIPMCHQLNLSHIDIQFEIENDGITIQSNVKTKQATGVEMEALTAVSVSALTIYDMCKAVDKNIIIKDISLVSKKGGKSSHSLSLRPAAGIITMSDGVYAGKREDISGDTLQSGLEDFGCNVKERLILPDGSDKLKTILLNWIKEGIELIITTGGTGLGPRDLTVPIVEDILESRLPGLEQAIHAYGRVNIKTATLSRLCIGKVENSIVVCLPGSPSAVSDGLDVLLPTVFHSFHMMKGEGH